MAVWLVPGGWGLLISIQAEPYSEEATDLDKGISREQPSVQLMSAHSLLCRWPFGGAGEHAMRKLERIKADFKMYGGDVHLK